MVNVFKRQFRSNDKSRLGMLVRQGVLEEKSGGSVRATEILFTVSLAQKQFILKI